MAVVDRTLAGSTGANFHCGYPAYRDRLSQLVMAARDIGFGVIRDDNPNAAKILRAAGWTGKVITVVGNAKDAETAIVAGTDMIDPINEIATTEPKLTASRAVLGQIYAQVAGRVPILATSIAEINQAKAKAVGMQAGARRANVHCYRGNLPQDKWRAKQAAQLTAAGGQAPFLPIVVGETGWHNYQVPGKPANYQGPENANHIPTPDDVAAQQLPGDLLAFFGYGADLVIYYEFVDQWRYRKTDGDADHEGYFGLLRDDLSYKAQTQQLKQLLSSWGNVSIASVMAAPPPFPSPEVVALQQQVTAMQATQAADASARTMLTDAITQATQILNQGLTASATAR